MRRNGDRAMSYLLTAPALRGLGTLPVSSTNYRFAYPIIGGVLSAPPANLVPAAPIVVSPSSSSPVVEPAPVSSLAPIAPVSNSTAQATAAGAQPNSVSVSSGPPSTWPTDQPYTDAAGNVWDWNPQSGWQIATPANAASGISSVFSNALAWLTSNSLLSTFGFSFPNWGVVAAALVGGAFLLGSHKYGGRHRR